MIKIKSKKAQQLIEFLLAAPFLIIILGMMTEYAYALNVNMTLSQGLKVVTSNIYKEIKPGFSSDDIKTKVLSDLTTYMTNNNVTTHYEGYSENALTLQSLKTADSTIFVASYRYYPAFTLPNVFFKILPDQMDFVASAAVPSAFMGDNSAYNIDTSTLNNINGTDASASSDDLYKGNKYGVFNQSKDRDKVLFLVPTSDYSIGDGYLIRTWDGTDLADNGKTLVLKEGSIAVYACSTATSCSVDNTYSVNKILSNYIPYNIIFVHDTSTVWLTPSGASDLSDENVSGILKRALAMADYSSNSLGNYDNFAVSTYNSAFPASTYTVKAVKTLLFVYSSSEDGDTVDAIAGVIKGSSALDRTLWSSL